jgi:hypothetical protein
VISHPRLPDALAGADAVLRDAYVHFADEAEASPPDVDRQPVPVPFQAMCQTAPKVTASNSTFCQ